MCEKLIKHKCKMDVYPFPQDMVIKSCIMDAPHNDIHNEDRVRVLCEGQIMMETTLEFQSGHHGNSYEPAAGRIGDGVWVWVWKEHCQKVARQTFVRICSDLGSTRSRSRGRKIQRKTRDQDRGEGGRGGGNQ